jgi:outer membrane scaffolding protein for murein synthesis (MipA/OmpV family)
MPSYRLPTLALGALAVATGSLAQPPRQDSGLQVQVGGGGLVTPDFLGSAGSRVRVLPYLSVNYDDLVSATVEDGIALNLYRSGDFTFGPIVSFSFGQEENDSRDLRGLGDVDISIEPGAFAEYSRGPFSAGIEASHDVAGGHGGGIVELDAAVTLPVAQTRSGPVLLSVGPGATFVTAKVNRAFFGVDATQALASGLPAYRPDGGLQEFGVNLTAIAPVGRRTTVVGLLGYGRLVGDAADSPRIRQRGSPDQFTAGLFIAYALF